MRALLLVALLAACAASPSSSSSKPPAIVGNTHAMYKGNRQPPPEKMAVLLAYSPPEEDGKTLVGRSTSDATGEDFRPNLDLRSLQLEPGRYRIEAYFWIARSRLENGKLLIENLQSGRIAPMEIVVEAQRTYYIRADLRRKDEVPVEERSGFFPLNYGATLADAEQLRRGDSRFLAASEYVWRPHLTPMTPAQVKQYWSHP